LLGLAVILAVLVITGDGARPAAAQPTSPHQECFIWPGPAPTPVPLMVKLETQFGTELEVQVGPGHYLCPPALKTYPPGHTTGELTDPHLRCYDIQGDAPENNLVTLKTQFGTEKVELGEAKMLCTPASKQVMGGPVPTATNLETPHYKCYEILDGTPPPLGATVQLQTQFGTTLGVAVGDAQYLCVPAIKTVLPNGTAKGDLQHPDLKCYSIDVAAPVRPTPTPEGPVGEPFVVEVETQFGFQVQPVGPGQLLCVPALKTLGVGGIAELPASAETAAEGSAAAGGSGWSAGAYAALAAGVAAAFAALGGATWYARRRWLS
jgi:hypothetical protein